jgi:MscS family membrane protein
MTLAAAALASVCLLLGLVLAAVPARAQNAVGEPLAAPFSVRTESPRATMETFLRLSDELETAVLDYQSNPTFAGTRRLAYISDRFVSLFDLQAVPVASRRETGIRTYSLLMDIFGRIGAPDLDALPDIDMVETLGDTSFQIPKTPFRIIRITEGDRVGDFLFSGTTVQIAPRFLGAVQHLPLVTRIDTDSLTDFGRQLTGPLVPPALVRAIPQPMKALWLDTPVWKVLAIGAVVAVLLFLLVTFHTRVPRSDRRGRVTMILQTSLTPVMVLACTQLVLPFVLNQINASGSFAAIIGTGETVFTYFAYAWLLWLSVRLFFEWLIRSPRIADESLHADMFRLLGTAVGLVGGAVVLAFGGQVIGIPILSVVAGLGIGGLAVALAVRPTLENLIGGVILYADKPVKVGDFCTFGDQTGTVEGIGLRSTKLRKPDRTLITVPNAQFSDMQIINWAECDQMLINETIGLRYETTPDQLRYVLAQLRRMFHAHPRIDSRTVRVRFSGYGASELKVVVRVYAETREWNDFFAIREDICFRIYDIVTEAGTAFAFPSQTLYMARDGGTDSDRAKETEDQVKRWRKARNFPFPRLSGDEIKRLEGTLDYPPRGSPDVDGAAFDPELEDAERLSEPSPRDDPEPAEPGGKDTAPQRQ